MYAHLIRSLKRRKYRNSIITRGLQHYIPSDIGLFYPPPYQVCRISKLSYLFHHCISRNISRHIRFSFVLPCLMSRQILKVKTENILQKQFEGYFLKFPTPQLRNYITVNFCLRLSILRKHQMTTSYFISKIAPLLL